MGGWLEAGDAVISICIIGFVVGLVVLSKLQALRLRFAGGVPQRRAPNPQRPTPKIRRSTTDARPPMLAQVVDETRVERISRRLEPAVLPLARWWPDVIDHDAHLMIVGETRSGKSTLARAILMDRARTDAIIVIDPHGKFNDWGVDVAGTGRSFVVIALVMGEIQREFERRFKPEEPVGEPITVFIDEYPAIVAARPDVAPLVKQWLRESAKAKIRLVFLTQDASVKALGIEGEGGVRANMRRVLLGRFAREASAAVAAREWPAVLDIGSKQQPVSLDGIPMMIRRVIDPSVMWPVFEAVPGSPAPAVPETAQNEAGTREPVGEPVPDGDGEPVNVSEKRAALIRRMHADDYTINDIAAVIGGKREKTLAMIRQALGEKLTS